MSATVALAGSGQVVGWRVSWGHPARVIYGITVLMAAVATLIIAATPLRYDGADLNIVWLFFSVVAAIGMLMRRRGMAVAGNVVELSAAFMLVSTMTSFTSAALASTAFPLADHVLQGADAMLGFSWSAMMGAIRHQDQALTLLSYVYVSLGLQPFVLIIMLVASRRETMAGRFVLAWAIALLATLAIFPFVPAVGNFASAHIPWGSIPGIRSPASWHSPRVLAALRDGRTTVLGSGALEGIVTFPSFHTAGAVLLGWGFWSLRHVRWLAIALNALMIVSALIIGGHYLVDIIAGAAVAIGAIAAANRTVRTAERSPG